MNVKTILKLSRIWKKKFLVFLGIVSTLQLVKQQKGVNGLFAGKYAVEI